MEAQYGQKQSPSIILELISLSVKPKKKGNRSVYIGKRGAVSPVDRCGAEVALLLMSLS